MAELVYFDCNATYGPHPGKHREARWTLEHLLEDLDLAQIAGALVQHEQGLHGDPIRANHTLVEDLRPHRGRLFPCWTAFPAGHGFPDSSAFVRELKQHDVRAVRIEAEGQGFLPEERIWGELRDALVAGNILVLIAIDRQRHDLEPTNRLLRIFRGAKTLLSGHCWQHWRAIEYFMEEYPNLHIEFSTFQANRAVEYFAERFGAERCLFGTGLMAKAPGAARGFLDWSLLPEQQATAIASGNLKRLLQGAGPAVAPPRTPWNDSLTAAARAGRPLPCEIWDNHCHILHDGSALPGGGLVHHKGDADGMIEITRRAGITKTAIMSWEGPASLDTDLGNDTVERAVARYPDEFIGLSTINPEHQSEAEIDAVIEKYHGKLHFPGLKTLISGQNINYDDPLLKTWYEFGSRHRLYAVIDPLSRQDSAMIANMVRLYPNLRISLDHCGQSWPYAKWAVEMVKRYPTVDAQLTYTNVTNGVIEYLVEQCGADRVMFGTDTPMRDPRPQVGWLVFTRLPEDQKRLIFGENFKRLLAQVTW
jgi:predicted TIM-barrel fold metal-dependent hydrolase